jgi:glycosyltransferase involved in cell wall biosynthesis
MVVGAYYPELSGGALQARQLIRALGARAACVVLTTTAVPEPLAAEVDGVPVHRVFVDPRHRGSVARAAIALSVAFVRLARQVDIVQLHGFSRKSILLMALATALRKRRVIKLTSVGDDDPPAVRARSRMAFAAYRCADLFVGVNPRQRELCAEAGIPPTRFVLIPNGVDVERFRPATPPERAQLRRALGLPEALRLTLFVGFFSREKQPHVLFEAWRGRGAEGGGLVFVGATRSPYHEIDPHLAETIRAAARREGVADRLWFVERTDAIEDYYRAADVFALPSLREGMPNALLEAMACGLPCVVSRLPGVTDAVIDDEHSGLLIDPADVKALAAALERVLAEPALAARLGAAARARVRASHSLEQLAAGYLAAYARLGPGDFR